MSLILSAAALVLAAATLVLVLRRPSAPPPIPAAGPEAFFDQMERAARGETIDTSVFGGPITVERKGGAVTVTAQGVPPSACVSVGWKLVRKGLLSINGVTPVRVSAAKLSDLCNQDDYAATLSWTPKE